MVLKEKSIAFTMALIILFIVLGCACWNRGVYLWGVYGEPLPSYSGEVLGLIKRLDSYSGLPKEEFFRKIRMENYANKIGALGNSQEMDAFYYRYCQIVPERYARGRIPNGDVVEIYEFQEVQDMHGTLWIHRDEAGVIMDYEIVYSDYALFQDSGDSCL